MFIPLEDNFADIIGKAQRGLKLSDAELAAQAGISLTAVEGLTAGAFDEISARAVASVLQLDSAALSVAAKGGWKPEPVEVTGLALFNTPFNDMTVNSYLVYDPNGLQAVAFDTGADCTEMLDFIRDRSLNLRLILLTHTHGDHIFELDRLKASTGAPAYVNGREAIDGAESFETGRAFTSGCLKIETRLTWGHSRGGTTYVVNGLQLPLAIVGDAIFAGSMGGGMVSYADALATNRSEILTLPPETVICPGHGPLTTVAEENAHNPFFVRGT